MTDLSRLLRDAADALERKEQGEKIIKRWAVISLDDFGISPRVGYAYLYSEKPKDTQVSGIGRTAFACIEINFRAGEGLSEPLDVEHALRRR